MRGQDLKAVLVSVPVDVELLSDIVVNQFMNYGLTNWLCLNASNPTNSSLLDGDKSEFQIRVGSSLY